jgi:RNA polymerase sigma-70 factor (ECF subfamily)
MSVADDRADPHGAFLALYERSLGDVYGYLVRRCPNAATAEDLTAETFLAAVRAVRTGTAELSIPWLIGTARHKLVDHWRREGRQREALDDLYQSTPQATDDNDPVDALHVHSVLSQLPPHHRAALTLRYLDGLPVEQVAAHLERSVHATESLLVRAKTSYRSACPPDRDEPTHDTHDTHGDLS